MRQLNKRQIKYLDDLMAGNNQIKMVDDLNGQEWQTLEAMNDHETLWQNAERYISDKRIKELYQ
jgi:hypothetical protein